MVELTPVQTRVLDALAQDGTSRGLTSGEICAQIGWSSEFDVELVLQTLIALELVEKRNQTSNVWPSGHPAEALPLGGGQIRSRTRYRATPTGVSLFPDS